jgi:tRNA A37 threonylcarbamoyladenosine biosynthesis protein TsaE
MILALEEYLDSGKLCCLEWPQHIEHLVEHPLKIEIEKMGLNSRKFSIFKV